MNYALSALQAFINYPSFTRWYQGLFGFSFQEEISALIKYVLQSYTDKKKKKKHTKMYL